MTETGPVESEVTAMLVTDVVDEIVGDNYKKLMIDLAILIIKTNIFIDERCAPSFKRCHQHLKIIIYSHSTTSPSPNLG